MSGADRRRPGRPSGTRKVSREGEAYGGSQLLLRLPADLHAWVREQGGQRYVMALLQRERAAASHQAKLDRDTSLDTSAATDA